MRGTVLSRPFILTVFFVVLIAAPLVGVNAPRAHSGGTESPLRQERIENFDIRLATSPEAADYLNAARERSHPSRVDAAFGNEMRKAAEDLKRLLGARISLSETTGAVEVIGVDPFSERFVALSRASGDSPAVVLKRFVAENPHLFGLRGDATATGLYTLVNERNDGRLSIAKLRQKLNGIEVFQGEISAGLTRDGRLVQVVNNLAAGVSNENVSSDFGDADEALTSAIRHGEIPAAGLEKNPRRSTKSRVVYGDGDWTTTAEKVYFPIEAGVAVPAWRILLWGRESAYYLVIDAASGTLLWRKNLSEDQSAAATYSIYASAAGALRLADSPTPFTPGCYSPTCGQPLQIARTSFSLIGNEAPNQFNNLGWIPDTGLPVRMPPDPNITDGNNVEAGIDRDGTNGVDPQGHAVGNPSRVFNYVYNPAPGLPPPGENPLPTPPQPYPPTPFQQGVTAHGFYLVNRWHDEMYRLGFTESAGNFQHFNFGRGGSEGDRISYEVQDGSGTTGANFAMGPDGTRGRMQNFIWPASGEVTRDGGLDSTIALHELTHGLSGRLHGNASGLSSNMARGLGEGWSDFYATALLSEPGDEPCGIYPVLGYVAYRLTAGYEANHYYGLRRFPYAKIGCTGPNGLAHNPLTFANLNAGNCTTFASAFPRGPFGVTSPCDQVHNAGEIWASALWEVRGRLIEVHGDAEGNRRAMLYATDGMKISPLNPTFIQARDALVNAAAATAPSDVPFIREGFRRRGMGFSASVVTSSPANVVEAFDFAPADAAAPFDFDGDGRSDLSVYRPSEGNWYLQRSTAGFAALRWGLASDSIMPADYDGDRKTDIAIFRRGENSAWYILESATSTARVTYWGATNPEQAILYDTPVPADYDGDQKADLAVWRTTDALGEPARFLVRRSSNSATLTKVWGTWQDVPVSGDFDGDGKADFAIFRGLNGQWWINRSIDDAARVYQFGTSSDRLVPADYTGDRKTDIAVWRPSTGEWFVLRSENLTYYAFPFGTSGDMPAIGDFDGDTKQDAGIFRPSNGTWYVSKSGGGYMIQRFGMSGDRPVPNAYVR